ncbi:MAG TPA: hypothetical protein VFA13_05185 [Candidatus Acidoferrum sp.]|nr:hypothetical protein [Candidatus Acidoferrum sp.]
MTVTFQLSRRYLFFTAFAGAPCPALALARARIPFAMLAGVLFGPGDRHRHPVHESLLLNGRQPA